jgi:ribonuclease D
MATALLTPRSGVPPLIESASAFELAIEELHQGNGPLAIDAERASGYRYSQRAYLIQIFRRGGGLHLIDPIAIGPTHLWKKLSDDFADQEWIIHASTQDLPCLREVGLEPQLLFDTELGARIAGAPRVGLGSLAESLLELTLAKEHSAVDWSIRPLRAEWLNYAALDVDILVDLRNEVEKLLIESGKLQWAIEDFAAIIKSPGSPPRKDPWRRTSGMHKIRDRQTLALIKELWEARDAFAREIDLSPGRIFNDEALITIATKRPATEAEMRKIIERRGRSENPPIATWHALMLDVIQWPTERYPEVRTPSTGIPPIKTWREKNPLGYARLTHARAAVLEISAHLTIPAENLISPELVRRICWPAPDTATADLDAWIRASFSELGARAWQIDLVTPALAAALLETEPLIAPVPEAPEGEETPADGEGLEK